jgi:hypothetical protein
MFVSSAVIALLTGVALGCDDPNDPNLNEVGGVLTVGLDGEEVRIGQSIRFEGRAATNAAVRVDSLVTWSVSEPNIVSVSTEISSAAGLTINRATVTGTAEGTVDLIARAGTKADTATITVLRSGI